MAPHHKIIIGDSQKMSELSDESVHPVVTSPPSWQLKDYGNKNQLVFHDSCESHTNNLNRVWNECFRFLHTGCHLCININACPDHQRKGYIRRAGPHPKNRSRNGLWKSALEENKKALTFGSIDFISVDSCSDQDISFLAFLKQSLQFLTGFFRLGICFYV